MTKLLECPECGEIKPKRDDAEVCGSTCRQRKKRRLDKEKTNDKSN